MMAAVALEVFCFSQLGSTEKPRSKPVPAPKAAVEEKKTRLGRPIRIIQING